MFPETDQSFKTSPDCSGYAVLQPGLLKLSNGIWTESRETFY